MFEASSPLYTPLRGLADHDQESEAESEDGLEFSVGYEKIEDNEELKLHILGLQSCYTKLLGSTIFFQSSLQHRMDKLDQHLLCTYLQCTPASD